MREPNQLILVTGGVRSGKASGKLYLEKGGLSLYCHQQNRR